MTKVSVMCIAVMLVTISAHAQEKTRNLDTNLLANLNSIENHVNNVMDMEGSRINFSRWDAPVGFIDAAKAAYDAQKVSAKAVHSAISEIKSHASASSIQLFFLYVNFRNLREAVDEFAKDAHEEQRDSSLATDLINLNTKLIAEESKLHDFVQNSILLDASKLADCR